MGEFNIDVDYKTLVEKAEHIRDLKTKVEAHKNACEAAGQSAVAAGGANTSVAGAIQECIVGISDDQFQAVMAVIDGFADAMEEAAGNYKKFDSNLTEGIMDIARKRKEKLESQEPINTAQ